MGGIADYIHELRRAACEELWNVGVIRLANSIKLSGIKKDTVTMHSVALAGHIGPDGTCKGITYSDQFGSWHEVIVQATTKISLKQMKASADTENDQIHMPGGLVCKWSAETCIDFEAGEAYWRKVPINRCSPQRHAVIYEGLAVILNTTHEDPLQPPSIIHTVVQDDKVFALRRTGPYQGCAIPA
ncbi:unnamed protein product [Angiostrongylus costaricensis]|uniref:BCAS3 domain-containing protein n=1 Tax=Angiostrongylus costaricensis TaxID=334426 RepID=A0A0R3PF23_ANGCS|nr:unnamed protein product [Angiostrongylus costaricensis]